VRSYAARLMSSEGAPFGIARGMVNRPEDSRQYSFVS
jgi:hypothetical protein